ncbi:hypothetical protein WKH31_07840 [Metabacillus indicus]|uniref:hypothetical protein n=1 Tax=Metabacillus indicus TaxID=246786 RepID=UPI003173AACF
MISVSDAITQSDYELFLSYNELLNTIEECFYYLIKSYESMEYTNREQIMDDLIDAFIQVDAVHSSMMHAARGNSQLQKSILLFDDMLEELRPAPEGGSHLFHAYLKRLSHLYTAWKRDIQACLLPYLLH